MKRFGVPTAPNGCGNDPESGVCESCTMRAARRGKWMIRQLLPLKYSTYYFTGGENVNEFVNVAFWRMWFGRVFSHESHKWKIQPVV